ncbi:unnamed protein product [Bursaphelenchus xylophilus]|uniref:Gluconokinase n=1 Tax=Bursaphelenchus xylophilus TaxID=6326 RepID=A0A1I7RTU2_BURXY|nr:unnamed protein product [Bursaphelenchus xylophilus]CAG9122109.1 unnamed protein product [Bursaphelenchus xylophilus]
MTIPEFIIIGGVAGCGKSTVGRLLADKLGYTFVDGDDYHSQENKAKMGQGIGLNDEDRAPWLQKLSEIASTSPRTVLGCSCLKKKYRDLFTASNPDLAIVILEVTTEHLVSRMAKRTGHYAKPNLLESQFRDFETPKDERNVFIVDGMETPEKIVGKIVKVVSK